MTELLVLDDDGGGGRDQRSKTPSAFRDALLELDIDSRMLELWEAANDIEEWTLEIAAAFMRAAFGRGYCDALTEDVPGSLCIEHGYRLPVRRREAA